MIDLLVCRHFIGFRHNQCGQKVGQHAASGSHGDDHKRQPDQGRIGIQVCGDAAVLVDPLEEEGIAAGIRRVLSDPVCADALREKGRQQEKKYSWDASAKLLRNLCREVLYKT